MVHKAIQSINDVKLELIHKFNTTLSHSSGCCVTKQGEFLFSNYEYNNGKIIASNADGEVVYTVPITHPYCSFDVASYDDSSPAVSTGLSIKHGISIVDIKKRKITQFIAFPGDPFGITYDGKSLICAVQFKDLHVISCIDSSITTIPNTVLPYNGCVSTHTDNIFYTNPDKHTVTCCLYIGVQVWEFKNPVLDRPQGIAVDNNRNVFVAGNMSCNVVVIFPDEKQCKQLLTKEDDLKMPTAISFDKGKNQLLVLDGTGFAYLYNISYC